MDMAVVVWNGSRSSSLRSMKQGRSSATQSPTQLEIEISGVFWLRRRASFAALPSAYAFLYALNGASPDRLPGVAGLAMLSVK